MLVSVVKHFKYEGRFFRDEFHGKGRFEYGDGLFIEGNWVNGVLEGCDFAPCFRVA